MNRFGLQTLINIFLHLQRRDLSPIEMFKYLVHWVFPLKKRSQKACRMFDRAEFYYLKKILIKLGQNDPEWFPRLIEPTTLGIRGWEYGVMFEKIGFRKMKVLDVGSGSSRLARNLSKKGAFVTMVDIEDPLEKTEYRKDKRLKFVLGDMTKMRFGSSTFDRVICISAVEHVDMKGGDRYFTDTEYRKRALEAVKEMCRVLKRKGVLYITTDFYLPEQKGDKWEYSTKRVRGAFPWSVIEDFIKTMNENGVRVSFDAEEAQQKLQESERFANYRGRFMTTIAFRGIKS